MSTLTEEEDRRTQPLPAKLAEAIGASLDELHRLADEAVPRETVRVRVPRAARPETVVVGLGSIGADVVKTLETGRCDVGVMVVADMTAVTRTARGEDDRFHLDLNVSLEGLDAYEVASVHRAMTQLRSLVAVARRENSEARITQLLRALAPPDPLADVELTVAVASADLRREFMERVPVLTSAQVHERAGFPGANPSATVHRWRKQGKVFSVNYGGRELYPAFQLGVDGRPLPIVGEVLEILARDKDRTDWDIALWFAGETGWLDGRTPIELLDSEPGLVKQAAEQEVLRNES